MPAVRIDGAAWTKCACRLGRLAMDQTRTATVFGISRERCSDTFEEARPMLDRDGSGHRLELGPQSRAY
jgi:hypothetical protein